MKLIITHTNLNEFGGAERVILRIAQRYKAKILVAGYSKDKTFSGFKDLDVSVIGSRPSGGVLPPRVSNAIHYGFTFFGAKIREDYDVINAHTSPSEWVRTRNSRVLWYCHSPPRELYDFRETGVRVRERSALESALYGVTSRIYSAQEHFIVRRLEAIATNSANTNGRLVRYLGRGGTVISPGVDYKRFHKGGDGRYFIYHSRISEQKRQAYAIEAFERFLAASKDKRYRLIISGAFTNRYADFAQYYEKLKAMRAKNVVFRLNPSDAETARLYAGSTAALFGAINEDFGIVPLEAMASSKPVVSVNEGGPKEIIVDGKTGFLVDSPEQMAKKMQFIAEHPKVAQQMGREGRRRVESYYSWEAFFGKFDPIVRKVSKMQ